MSSAGYTALARVYDRWQQSYGKDYSSLILPRLLGTFHRHGIPPSTLLDVACGTGTLAVQLARKGWAVWGVDASAGMLQAAQRRAVTTGLPLLFRRGDMRSFRMPVRVRVATCLFDALNHLLSVRDLRAACRRVAAHLEPGGYFVFDVNTIRCFELLWNGTQVVERADFTLILQTGFDPRARTGTSHVTVFEREGKVFRRSAETVRERYFTPEEITGALAAAGLTAVERRGFNFTPLRKAGEVKDWWVARREG